MTMLASGCDPGEDLAPSQGDPSASTGTPSPSASQQSPDQELVDEVLGQLAAALAVLAQARKAPLLRKTLTPLVKAHRQHVLVLEGELADEASPGPSPDPAAMLRLVHRGERDLQAELVDAAGRAESGALARLLASMSASVTQHLTLIPPEVAS
jgi:hypothetical protein